MKDNILINDAIRYQFLKNKALKSELESFVALNQLDYCYSDMLIDNTIDEAIKEEIELNKQ